MKLVLPLIVATLLTGCQGADSPSEQPAPTASPAPVQAAIESLEDGKEATAYEGIGPDEVVRFTGTEPFWGGQVAGTALTYSTPETPDGTDIRVERFAGRGGLSWSGSHSGARLVLAVTPGECSDGMSDRSYPFVATLEVAGEQRSGCAWTDRQPFSGPDTP